MLHDQALLDWLADFSPTSFEGIGFRATRRGLDPLVPSTSGGRWMPADTEPVLYTNLERNGAIAEVIHHWSRQNPPPSKPLLVHTLQITVGRLLSISAQALRDTVYRGQIQMPPQARALKPLERLQLTLASTLSKYLPLAARTTI
jgi:hypothetical protein